MGKCYDLPRKASKAHDACSPSVRPWRARKPTKMHFPSFVGSRSPRSPASVPCVPMSNSVKPVTPTEQHQNMYQQQEYPTVRWHFPRQKGSQRQEYPAKLGTTFYTFRRNGPSVEASNRDSLAALWKSHLSSSYCFVFDINMQTLSCTRMRLDTN